MTQVFIKQLAKTTFNLNGNVFNLLEMDEEALIALGQEAETCLNNQKMKILTAEGILANTLSKRPTMEEVTNETAYLKAESKYKFLFSKWQQAVETAKKNLNNARVKKGLLQNLIVEIGFAWTKANTLVSITNIDTQESMQVSKTMAEKLTQQEDWVYSDAFKMLN